MYYLDPEFDSRKLTKSELRSIMASHGVDYLPPPNAKKDELLKLFQKEIVGKRKAILESIGNIKAKSDGIVFLDDSSRPSPKKPKKRTLPTKIETHEYSPSPSKSETIERPETPISVSTHKLVSRLENLDNSGDKSKIRRQLFAKKTYSLAKFSLFLIISCSAVLWIYLKFWFIWPLYTQSQLNRMNEVPILYLKCPYAEDSKIGSCSEGKLYCSNGYVEKRDVLGFNRSCIIDKERLSLIQTMKRNILFELQSRLGSCQCYADVHCSIPKKKLFALISHYFKNLKPRVYAEYFDIALRSLIQEGSKIEYQHIKYLVYLVFLNIIL